MVITFERFALSLLLLMFGKKEKIHDFAILTQKAKATCAWRSTEPVVSSSYVTALGINDKVSSDEDEDNKRKLYKALKARDPNASIPTNDRTVDIAGMHATVITGVKSVFNMSTGKDELNFIVRNSWGSSAEQTLLPVGFSCFITNLSAVLQPGDEGYSSAKNIDSRPSGNDQRNHQSDDAEKKGFFNLKSNVPAIPSRAH